MMAKGQSSIQEGKYRHAMEILNKLVYAEPSNQDAKDLLADTYEQMGYQFGKPEPRAHFLAGAKELRDGVNRREGGKARHCGFVRGTAPSCSSIPRHPDGQPQGRRHEIQVQSHSPGHRRKVRCRDEQCHPDDIDGFQANDADLTITLNRTDFEEIMLKKAKLADLVQAGKARLEGNPAVLKQLAGSCEMFDPMFGEVHARYKGRPEDLQIEGRAVRARLAHGQRAVNETTNGRRTRCTMTLP